MIARPLSEAPGPKQQMAIDGPYGPAMQTFVCKSCSAKFPDTGLYFYGKSSVKCLWCTKFPDRTK